MKSEIIALTFVFFILILSTLIISAKDNVSEMETNNDNSTQAKNMTYGQCVVEAVQIKNLCYESVKQTKQDCINNSVKNSTKIKKCKTDIKKSTKQCKTEFKTAKKECVQKTKPRFFERMRYSLT